jgi:hypothetical protein
MPSFPSYHAALSTAMREVLAGATTRFSWLLISVSLEHQDKGAHEQIRSKRRACCALYG